ncbi:MULTISPECIES: sulfatase-like hydrolase/transferase [unclassified Saccharopolyspora]|uniref:sulfatase-like hydrolase/transferase n=1 Tax=unclassified Saccharopolyspora TaxID=2646250 RepID=UPI001CD3D551|nr:MULTISPECIES: sulfatase-like hydrolase/transferase [unclassified Saccharopolyspora]MCA1189108.1 sulfatase-like hydrolase/transferase [Saccharopolyspora sp. 6T]MCA1283541.1 sulfatase-like hydrolase/transferase [Saccharopolyspora sp. 7B]
MARSAGTTRIPVAVLLVLGVLLAGCARPVRTAAPASRPNVVVVMTDDQWLDSVRFMPNVQRLLGLGGATFDRYYASFPLCCPSRSTFLSGQLAHNNGVRHNAPPLGGYDALDEENALPVWMQRAGYTTSHIGKYPNGYGKSDETHVPPGWDEWRGSIDPTTYDMYGYRLNENGRLRTYGDPWVQDPAMYQTDVYRDKAIDFIDRRSAADDPFFLSVAFLAPHGENVHGAPDNGDFFRVGRGPRPALRHQGEFAAERPPYDASYGEQDVADKPEFLRDYPEISAATGTEITTSYRLRLESLLAVDEAVQRIVDALRANGELDDTYLMFVSDNGFFFGQHRVPTGKFLPHEAAAHVPLLLRGPGIAGGAHVPELSTNTDLTATITDIGGAEPTIPLDGRSLLPFARDPLLRTGRPLLHEAAEGALPDPVRPGAAGDGASALDVASGRAAGAGDLDQDGSASPPAPAKSRDDHSQVLDAAYEAIRTERYLYVRYVSGDHELYDLHVDPDELASKHDDARYTQVRAFLDRHLDALQGCRGAECARPIPAAPRPG